MTSEEKKEIIEELLGRVDVRIKEAMNIIDKRIEDRADEIKKELTITIKSELDRNQYDVNERFDEIVYGMDIFKTEIQFLADVIGCKRDHLQRLIWPELLKNMDFSDSDEE